MASMDLEFGGMGTARSTRSTRGGKTSRAQMEKFARIKEQQAMMIEKAISQVRRSWGVCVASSLSGKGTRGAWKGLAHLLGGMLGKS